MQLSGAPYSWISLVCLLLANPTQGAKILLLPIQAISQCLEIGSVGQELANRGHDVAIFLDSQFNHKNCYERGYNGTKKIRSILFQRGTEIKRFDYILEEMSRGLREGEELSIFNLLPVFREISWHQCAALFSDQNAMNQITKEHFDLAIVQGGFAAYCYVVLPYKLNVSYVTVGTKHEDFVSSRPFLPSIVPDLMTTFTDEMNFFQRLINYLRPMLFHVMVKSMTPMDLIAKVAPELSTQDVINLASKSELFLYNHDTVLSYPVPTMPNHILVGGLTAQPSAPLNGVFKDFYQKSTDGVIVVSFGSMIGSLPPSVTDSLMAALQKLNIAVLWKHTQVDKSGKIERVKWLPQNDLLGHPKTRLFVSHCGNNGVFEALFHGVPLVCTPINGDQFYNSIRVQKWAAGIIIPLLTSSEETLFDAIYEVLNNSTYKANMMKASEIYHSRPENARERAAFWIEHVLRFGGEHLRSEASDMSVFTYLGYDVLVFLLACDILGIMLIAKAVLLLFRRCCRRRKSEKMKTT